VRWSNWNSAMLIVHECLADKRVAQWIRLKVTITGDQKENQEWREKQECEAFSDHVYPFMSTNLKMRFSSFLVILFQETKSGKFSKNIKMVNKHTE